MAERRFVEYRSDEDMVAICVSGAPFKIDYVRGKGGKCVGLF